MLRVRTKRLAPFVCTLILWSVQASQVAAQVDTGYDRYGDYIEHKIIDENEYRKQETKRLEGKRQHYVEMIEKNPENPTPYHYLGSLYLELEHPQKAIHTYQNLLSLNPSDAKAHFNLSKAFSRVKDGTNAIRHMEKANQIFRDNFDLRGQTKTRKLLKKLRNQYVRE